MLYIGGVDVKLVYIINNYIGKAMIMESSVKQCENLKIGDYVKSIRYDDTTKEFVPVEGILTGLFCDPSGISFAQVKPAEGHAYNVHICTVNGSSEARQAYMDVINQIVEIQDAGNAEIERVTKEIAEINNSKIQDLYATLYPLVDMEAKKED